MTRSSVATKRPKKRKKEPRTTASPLSRTAVVKSVKREPLGHLLLEKLLYAAGFSGTIATDTETLTEFSTDESIFKIMPQIVLRPKTAKDIETVVSVLGAETKRFPSISLTPRAAGTGLSGGSLTDSVVIDVCEYLADIGKPKISGDTATIICEPGAMWRDVEAALAEHGFYIPAYPASKDFCTIGGSVANNAAGPDSLRYGHVAEWVDSVDVVLSDGNTYTIQPLTYKAFTKLIKEDHEHARIAREVFTLIEENETAIKRAHPKTAKNTAGYALWDVLDGLSVKEFKRGVGTFDLTRLISGSQGTLGIVTSVTMRAIPLGTNTQLIAVPVFDLVKAGTVVQEALKFNPLNIEVFDDLTFDLALKNPQFFRKRLSGTAYYKSLFSMYATYHVRYRGKTPMFTLLVTLDDATLSKSRLETILAALKKHAPGARHIVNESEVEMLWQLRRASYPLSKLEDPTKRPAPFLEDMVVPPQHLAPFFTNIKRLLKKYNVVAAVHGHGGNGHFHFYPLLDFTRRSTPALIEKMADEFFALALKYDGSICGEHNDGIIRTPYLTQMFSKTILNLFVELEHIFDPDDIFNPGKKVNPRFDIKDSIRDTN
ncbi:MAG: FAD-binding oxidoreductase [Candidatus Paceibacterota bacterium]